MKFRLNLPYIMKCKCCGKRIGFWEWCRVTKEMYRYMMLHANCLDDGKKTSKEIMAEVKERFKHKMN